MAIYETRTTTVTRREWVLPAATERGVPIGEFTKAFVAARVAYQDAHNLPPAPEVPDDAFWVRGEDGRVVLYFEVHQEADR